MRVHSQTSPVKRLLSEAEQQAPRLVLPQKRLKRKDFEDSITAQSICPLTGAAVGESGFLFEREPSQGSDGSFSFYQEDLLYYISAVRGKPVAQMLFAELHRTS